MPQPPKFVLLCLLPLAACGPDYSPNTYSNTAVQQAAKVDQGVVVGARRVGVTSSGATGAMAGGAAGAALGAAAPTPGRVSTTLGAIGGSLIGGLVGAGAEKAVGETTAFEYIVRKPSGELISVTQKDDRHPRAGDRRQPGTHRARLHRAARQPRPRLRAGTGAADRHHRGAGARPAN